MKRSLFWFICLLAFPFISPAQTAETFDIATFQPPKGWEKQVGADSVQFLTEDKKSGTFCIITLTKSMPALGNSKENFEAAWGAIVKESVNVSAAPQMFPSNNPEDWALEGGFAPFEKDGVKGVALLYTISGHGKMMNAMILTNGQTYEPQITAFLESFSFKKPLGDAAPAAVDSGGNTPILGTWGQNLGAHMTYGDPVAAGMAGYSKDQYTFNANGTYTFVSKTFRMAYDKIILVIENGTYQISGGSLSIKPQKSVIQAWSKQNGGDKFGRLLSSRNRTLETVTYRFTRHYFSGIDQWNLVLQADKPTERDGPFSSLTLFPNAWYYKPISANNPVIELPK